MIREPLIVVGICAFGSFTGIALTQAMVRDTHGSIRTPLRVPCDSCGSNLEHVRLREFHCGRCGRDVTIEVDTPVSFSQFVRE